MSQNVAEALVWAEPLHRGQLRRGKAIPCLSQLLAVSALVWEDGGDGEQVIAALLHDAIEGGGHRARLHRHRRGLERSLLVIAADKAHNAADMALDGRRDPAIWSRFSARIEATAWYLLRVHQQLSRRLPGSRSVERLGEAVSEILGSGADQRIVPRGSAPAVWAAGYGERHRVAEES